MSKADSQFFALTNSPDANQFLREIQALERIHWREVFQVNFQCSLVRDYLDLRTAVVLLERLAV